MTDLIVKWHMTLITWFRDYLYIPLGGNRKGPYKTYRNLFIIMFISGVWARRRMDLHHLGLDARRCHSGGKGVGYRSYRP